MKKNRSFILVLVCLLCLFFDSFYVNAETNYDLTSSETEVMSNELLDINSIISAIPIENDVESDLIVDVNDALALDKRHSIDIHNLKELENENSIEDALEDAIAEEDDNTTGSLVTGSLSGYLTSTNDYALYPAQLSAGEYLQASVLTC